MGIRKDKKGSRKIGGLRRRGTREKKEAPQGREDN
jgi:hypothetical protein